MLFVVKAKQTPNLPGAARQTTRWQTVGTDADGNPHAKLPKSTCSGDDWPSGNERYRVLAVRTNEGDNGRQVPLRARPLVQFYVTNDHNRDIDDLAPSPLSKRRANDATSRFAANFQERARSRRRRRCQRR
jgi:hypothetical protein